MATYTASLFELPGVSKGVYRGEKFMMLKSNMKEIMNGSVRNGVVNRIFSKKIRDDRVKTPAEAFQKATGSKVLCNTKC
jgi:hypothetical protein